MFLWILPCSIAVIAAGQSSQNVPCTTIDNTLISVRLTTSEKKLRVAVPAEARALSISDTSGGKLAGNGLRMITVSLEASGSSLVINNTAVHSERITIASPDGLILFNGRRYRGRIEVKAMGGALQIANILPLRSYLASVVGAEMPSDAPFEALKAQSVISRSYILHRMVGAVGSDPFICDSVLSQVYGGVSTECAMTIKAVRETAGLVLTFNDEPIDACFSASSGGWTASAKDVWDNSVPYLVGKRDPFSESGKYGDWQLRITPAECEKLLLEAGYDIGSPEQVVVIRQDRAGRASRIAILGTKGDALFRATDFRLLIGASRLRSTMFDVERGPGGFTFRGKGFGHGVGLSQQGACNMAKQNYSFEQILAFYYTGVKLERFPPDWLNRQSTPGE